ncbi:hypothetical protein HK105_203181 [Polyrhizophydium stewartii]|uniref:Cyclin N-terminal domain-containing protein n=1 Tax=Polyrhizophydium stewartii TaxID=2732419 RepID=A0ABR4NC90_9FUNG|nr:hypothetical protein HK105_005396 [Polyrhizophydium stewartii]
MNMDPRTPQATARPDFARFATALVLALLRPRGPAAAGAAPPPASGDIDAAASGRTAAAIGAILAAAAPVVPLPTVLVALKLIQRVVARRVRTPARGAEAHMFLVALVVAQKTCDDAAVPMRFWSQVSGLPPAALAAMERQFLASLHFATHVSPASYRAWVLHVHSLARAAETPVPTPAPTPATLPPMQLPPPPPPQQPPVLPMPAPPQLFPHAAPCYPPPSSHPAAAILRPITGPAPPLPRLAEPVALASQRPLAPAAARLALLEPPLQLDPPRCDPTASRLPASYHHHHPSVAAPGRKRRCSDRDMPLGQSQAPPPKPHAPQPVDLYARSDLLAVPGAAVGSPESSLGSLEPLTPQSLPPPVPSLSAVHTPASVFGYAVLPQHVATPSKRPRLEPAVMG